MIARTTSDLQGGTGSAAGVDSSPQSPGRSLSVVIATKRPEMLAFWPALLAAQDYPDFEVIAVFHGEAFTAEHEAVARGWLGERLTVLRVPERCVLGNVLNQATAAAAGELIVKWDDDDLYSSRHLSDLAMAHRESGATVVGKQLEYVYLASLDRTIRLKKASGLHRTIVGESPLPPGSGGGVEAADRSAAYAATVSGNTLCLSRDDLKQLGGWREVPFAADSCLVADALRQDGRLHCTSGSGHLVLRNPGAGHRHTWVVRDEALSRWSMEDRAGADAGFAGVDVPPPLLTQWARQRPSAV